MSFRRTLYAHACVRSIHRTVFVSSLADCLPFGGWLADDYKRMFPAVVNFNLNFSFYFSPLPNPRATSPSDPRPRSPCKCTANMSRVAVDTAGRVQIVILMPNQWFTNVRWFALPRVPVN